MTQYFLFIYPKSDIIREQVQFCHNLIAKLFEKGNSHACKQAFFEIRRIRKILDHCIKSVCDITSYSGRFSIEIMPSQPKQTTHQTQTDDIEIEFLKVFTEYILNKQHQNSKEQSQSFETMFSL